MIITISPRLKVDGIILPKNLYSEIVVGCEAIGEPPAQRLAGRLPFPSPTSVFPPTRELHDEFTAHRLETSVFNARCWDPFILVCSLLPPSQALCWCTSLPPKLLILNINPAPKRSKSASPRQRLFYSYLSLVLCVALVNIFSRSALTCSRELVTLSLLSALRVYRSTAILSHFLLPIFNNFSHGTMTSHENVIAWLVPTARGSNADKTTHMSENVFRTITIASSQYLNSRLPNLIISRPQKAIQISFDQTPKRPGRFVLGTDPRSCDIILPAMPGVARQHCSLSFDCESRLMLEDFSEQGTQVWYDWESAGDRTDHTWVLCSPSSTTQRITVDIQGLRFQVLLNEHKDINAYKEKVETFCQTLPWVDGLTVGWDRASVAPVLPLFTSEPLFRYIFVKGIGGDEPRGEMYLWNITKPWEPMVKAAA